MENHWRFGCPPKKWGWSEQKWRWFYGYYVLIFAGSLSRWLVVKCYRTESRRGYNGIFGAVRTHVWFPAGRESIIARFGGNEKHVPHDKVLLGLVGGCPFFADDAGFWQNLHFHQTKLRSCARTKAYHVCTPYLLPIGHSHPSLRGRGRGDGVMRMKWRSDVVKPMPWYKPS